MALRVGAREFAPRLLPTLLTLVMLPLLLGLGTWQVHRLHWKQQLLATIADRVDQVPVDVPLPPGEDADYRPAKAQGHFLNAASLYVFATDTATGKGGYHVITPLALKDGGDILVDRGWIPFDHKEGGYSQPAGDQTVQGILRVPPKAMWLTPANNPAKGEWYSVDVPAMAAVAHMQNMLPYVLEAGPAANEGGFPVGGQSRLTLPNDHLSYAITWYSFAAILLIIYVVSGLRPCRAEPKA